MERAGDTSRPAISQRIAATRKRLQEQWKADHANERPNRFSQEEVARRVGVSLGAYGAWERNREPDLERLRQIAKALDLDADYFSPTGDLASATARVARFTTCTFSYAPDQSPTRVVSGPQRSS